MLCGGTPVWQTREENRDSATRRQTQATMTKRAQEADLKIGLISSIYSSDMRLFNFKRKTLQESFKAGSLPALTICTAVKKKEKKEHQAEFFFVFLEQPEH